WTGSREGRLRGPSGGVRESPPSPSSRLPVTPGSRCFRTRETVNREILSSPVILVAAVRRRSCGVKSESAHSRFRRPKAFCMLDYLRQSCVLTYEPKGVGTNEGWEELVVKVKGRNVSIKGATWLLRESAAEIAISNARLAPPASSGSVSKMSPRRQSNRED